MSAALLDELLAAFAAPTPAKAANTANREHPCRVTAESEPCEGLRIAANSRQDGVAAAPDSQKFAAVRILHSTSEAEVRREFSQESQDSQGVPATWTVEDLDLAAVAWADADIARFLDRRARLLRWGWAEPEAERLAEKLVIRDREADDRVSCIDCGHFRPGHCGNHRRAGLNVADVGRDLASLLQRCPGIKP